MNSLIYRFLPFAFVVYFTFNGIESIAQSEVGLRGKVYDEETKEPIPFANVFIKHKQKTGMVTDFDGGFRIYTKRKKRGFVTLVCSFIGYEPIEKIIDFGHVKDIVIYLTPESTELEEVVFEAPENPAYEIVRRAAKRKKKSGLNSLGNLLYSSYNRTEVILKNVKNAHLTKLLDKAEAVVEKLGNKELMQKDGEFMVPLFVTESLSDNYQKEKEIKEVIRSKKISGLGIDADDNLSQLITGNGFRNYDFRENNINILDKSFPSPISDTWRLYYEVWLMDSLYVGSDYCYKIDVEPRIKGDIAFQGTIWITKDTYDLKKFALNLPKEANINFVESIEIEQTRRKEEGIWHVAETRNTIDVSEIDLIPGVLLKFTIKNDSIKRNPDIPEEIFSESFADTDEQKVEEKDEFWEKYRNTPSDSSFVNLHTVLDSVQAQPDIKRASDIGAFLVNGYLRTKYLDFGHYLFLYANNNVEGNRVQLGFRTNSTFSKKWFIKPSLAYGFKDEKFKYDLTAQYVINRKKASFLGFNASKDLISLSSLDLNRKIRTRYLAWSRWGDLKKKNPYYVDSYNLSYSVRANRNFTPSIKLKHSKIRKATISKDLQGVLLDAGKYDLDVSTLNLGLRFAKNERLILTQDNTLKNIGPQLSPVFRLDAKLGVYKNQLGQSNPYQSINLSMRQRYAPIFGLGSAKYFINAGMILNKVPYELLKKHEGNTSIFSFGSVFQMMNNFEFVSDYYVEARYEHFFEGRLITRIPVFKYLNRFTEARIVMSGGLIYGGLTDKNREFNKKRFEELGKEAIGVNYIEDVPYAEAGVGLENIFHFLRVDVFKRFTYLDANYEIQPWGIKLSASVKF